MPCSITITSVNGIVQLGQSDPSVLRVTGNAAQCSNVRVTSSVTAPSGPVPVDGNGRFRADIPISTPLPHCGDLVDVRVECDGQPTCFDLDQQRVLTCCDVPVLFFQGFTPMGSLTPSQLVVQGVARGCPLDQVVISSTHTATSAPIPVDPLTGAFTASLPLTTAAQCDDEVSVTVVCPSGAGCQVTIKNKLDCASCFRAALSVVVGPCHGNPQVATVTLQANIGLPPGATQPFEWVFGDGTTSPQFTITNTGPTAATSVAHTETHDYAPGTYNVVLRVPGSECPTLQRTVVVQCASATCPTITVDPPQLSAMCVNGKYTVTLTSHIAAPTGQSAVVQWTYGDGSFGPAILVNSGASIVDVKTHDYGPGTYTATLTVISPPNCPPTAVTVVVPTCPTVCTLQVQNIATQIGACDPVTGHRTVVATGVVNNTDPADLYYWQWDANPAQVGLPPTTGTTQQHDYAAPGSTPTSYTITLTVVRNATCVSTYSKIIAVDGCGGGCPTISSLQLNGTAGMCTADRLKRAVSLGATVTDASSIVNYHWAFDDGTSLDLPGSAGPTATHDMGPGMHTVTLTITGPGTCTATSSAQVDVTACCPIVTGIGVSPGACASTSSTTRPMSLTAQVAGMGATTFDWNFGDGSPTAVNAGAAPPARNYVTGSTFTATVTMHSPGCPDTTASASFTPATCQTTTTNTTPCDVLLWLSIAFVLFGFLVGIIGCIVEHWFPQAGWIIQIIGGALVLIGVILFFIWWIVCRFITPCQVILAVREFVRWLIRIFAIITIIMAIISIFIGSFRHCALYAAVTWGYWGLVLDMLDFIAEQRGCIIVNPSGGGSGSSSNPLTSSGDTSRMRSNRPDQWMSAPAGSLSAAAAPAENGASNARMNGLGDAIKAATNAVGIKPCAPCHERARKLNALVPFGPAPAGELE